MNHLENFLQPVGLKAEETNKYQYLSIYQLGNIIQQNSKLNKFSFKNPNPLNIYE